MTTDLDRDPPASPVGQHQPRRRDRRHLLGPRPRRTSGLWAAPPALVPHQPDAATERREVDQHQPRTVLDPRRRPARAAPLRPDQSRLDVDLQRDLAVTIVDRENGHGRISPTSSSHIRVASVSTGVLFEVRS